MHIAEQLELYFPPERSPVRWDLIHCPTCGRETGGGYCDPCRDIRDDASESES